MSIYTGYSMLVTLVRALYNRILTRAIPRDAVTTHIGIGTVRELLLIQHPGRR